MADVADISTIIYPANVGMINNTGNVQHGVLGQGSAISQLLPGSETGDYMYDMIPITLDGTGTDASHRAHETVFTYANGVYVDVEYYLTPLGLVCTATHKDINDNTIDTIPARNFTADNNKEMYYNPFYTGYGTTSGEQSQFPRCDYISVGVFYVLKEDYPDFPHLDGFEDERALDRHFKYIWQGPDITTQEQLDAFINAIDEGGNGSPILPKDWTEDDPSGPGGGGGDYDPGSDPIGHPTLPIGGDAISTGFVRVYNPSTGQLHALASKLWSDDFFNTIKKIQNDPMEAVISLHSIPFTVSTVSGNCVVGNYDAQIAMPAVLSQFVSKSLGFIYIPEHWGSALDYSPYVVVDCFIPFVGVRSLQVDDAIGKRLDINANIDILTGTTIVTVMCGNSVLYAWNTNVIVKHPISMSSMGPLYQAVLGMAGNVVNGAVSGGIGGAVGGGLGSAINVATSKHSQITRGGAIAGNSGALGHFTPYLIIHRPKQSLASGFAHFKGYPSNITATLGNVSGYTEVESVHLTGIPGTDAELEEIRTLLYNGVIL